MSLPCPYHECLPAGSFGLVVVGASLGGLRALRNVLSALPKCFRTPLAIVQHCTHNSGYPLQVVLQECCALQVLESEDKTLIKPGTVYLAPVNYHLLVEGDHLVLSTDDAELYARPSINALFESAAESWGRHLAGVVLAGTGQDGLQGLAAIEAAGGLAVVERQDVAQVVEMPCAAVDAAPRAVLLRLEEIGPYLVQLSQH